LNEKRKLSKTKIGTFSGWKILIFATDALVSGWLPVLKAGDANIVSTNSNQSNFDFQGVTHAFFDLFDPNKSTKELQLTLLKSGVTCLSHKYISDYLLLAPTTSHESLLAKHVLDKNSPVTSTQSPEDIFLLTSTTTPGQSSTFRKD